jgi:hypothetical protein
MKPALRKQKKNRFIPPIIFLCLLLLLCVVSFRLSTAGKNSETVIVDKNTFAKKEPASTPASQLNNPNIPSPTPGLQYSDLTWSTYEDKEMKVRFSYPVNLPSQQYAMEHTSLQAQSGLARITWNMSYVFSIGKIETNLTFEEWERKELPLENYLKITKTEFRNKPAYYCQSFDNGQVPYDVYIVKHGNNILLIDFVKPLSVRRLVNDYIVSHGGRTQNQAEFEAKMEEMAKYDDEYYGLDNLVIGRIMSSLEFL